MPKQTQRVPARYRSAVLMTYGVLFLEGVLTIILIASMSPLVKHYGVTKSDISVMIALRGFGCMVSLPFSGALSDKYGRRNMILLGALLCGVFFVGMALTTSFTLGLILCVLAGIGHGFMEPSAMALLFDIFEDAGPAMSISQIFFGGGSALTSFLAAVMVQSGTPWQALFWMYAGVNLLLVILAIAFKAPPINSGTQTRAPVIAYTKPPQLKPAIWLLGAAIFINSCATTLLFTWITEYAHQFKGFEQAASMQVLTGYQVGAVISALTFAWVLTRVHTTRLMVLNPIVATAALGLALLTRTYAVLSISILLYGVMIGVVFSLMITTGGALFPHRSGTVTGILGMANMMGNSFITLLSGQALRFTGVDTLMVVALVLQVVVILLSVWFRRYYLAHNPQATPDAGRVMVR